MDPLATPIQSPITKIRPRWQIGQGPNPLGGFPALHFLGEKVYFDADGNDVGQPWRDPSLDYRVVFDPQNPLHVQTFGLLDQIVKEAHAQALAKLQAAKDAEKEK